MRLASLTTGDAEAQVKDESVLDTVADVHNYVDYLALMWSQRKTGWGVERYDGQPTPDPGLTTDGHIPGAHTATHRSDGRRWRDHGHSIPESEPEPEGCRSGLEGATQTVDCLNGGMRQNPLRVMQFLSTMRSDDRLRVEGNQLVIERGVR